MVVKIDRTGEKSYNKFGSLMKIIDYRNCNDFDIYFPEYNWTYFSHSSYYDFRKGKVSCPYERKVYNVGYVGEGIYKVKDINGNNSKAYITWHDMLKRYYNEKIRHKYPTYNDCYVCEDWLNFQNFAKWHHENYYEVKNERMNLDKDIISKHNKIYSPDTCLYTPHRINSLFVKRESMRNGLPIGVQRSGVKYIISCSGVNYPKTFENPEDAFNRYKYEKEKLIKQVADEYKNYIPTKLYDVMYKYEVDVND